MYFDDVKDLEKISECLWKLNKIHPELIEYILKAKMFNKTHHRTGYAFSVMLMDIIGGEKPLKGKYPGTKGNRPENYKVWDYKSILNMAVKVLFKKLG